MTGIGVSANRLFRSVSQRASHAHLFRDVSGAPSPPRRSRRARLDAVIVPASRPASTLRRTIEFSASFNVLLVVLCSKQTRLEQVAQRVSKTPGARSLIIKIPERWAHPIIPTRTSAAEFRRASADRLSDLSAKRNLGLLLARLNGWNKVAFIDDDISLLGGRTHPRREREIRNIARLASQLDVHQVAGMRVQRHPDNSVVCHARRLAGVSQAVFVTGAVLGVHCNSLPLSFFPDIYNEDWFFFAKEAAARRLPCVGVAQQSEYDPFAMTDRARREEFGDLLAEGLYALIGEEDPSVPFYQQLRAATGAYWSRFMEARRDVITETAVFLRHFLDQDPYNGQLSSALDSLRAAEDQLATLTPDLCVEFLDAWQQDLGDWQRFSNRLNNVGSTREAMDFLQLKTWTRAEFGAAAVDSAASPARTY
jgi:hypothetical protein